MIMPSSWYVLERLEYNCGLIRVRPNFGWEIRNVDFCYDVWRAFHLDFMIMIAVVMLKRIFLMARGP